MPSPGPRQFGGLLTDVFQAGREVRFPSPALGVFAAVGNLA